MTYKMLGSLGQVEPGEQPWERLQATPGEAGPPASASFFPRRGGTFKKSPVFKFLEGGTGAEAWHLGRNW